MSGRRAEHGQHGVTGELLDGALVAQHLPGQSLEGIGHQARDELGIATLVEAGEVDDVSEEQRGHLAFATRFARRGERDGGSGLGLALDPGGLR